MALHLASKGDHRSLVVLVEKWAAIDAPTPAARIAAARSFVELRLLDRAWVRLKELVEGDEPSTEALLLAGRMFLLRGWPNQARKVLQRGLEAAPDDKRLQALWDSAGEAATEPDEASIDSETAMIDDLLRVAEEYMAHGSFLRARGLLERVRRRDPEHRRAADLLWAIEGDFSSDAPLDVLCENLGPDLAFADLSDDPEHTESADLDSLPLQLDRDESEGGFPILFRNLEAQTEAYHGVEAEVTSVASMSELAELDPPTDPSEQTDPHGDDTQIMRVVHKSGSAEPAAPDDKSLNLADLETPDVSADYTHGTEDEDDSVVIVTRREDDTAGRDQTTDAGGIQLDTQSEKEASLKQGTVEEARWAAPPGDDPTDRVKPKKPSPKPKPSPRPRSRSRNQSLPEPPHPNVAWPWWMAALVVLLACGVVVFGAIALIAAL